MIAAVGFYLLVTTIMLFSDFTPMPEDVYSSLIFPGLLIMFYPVLFSIQNDKDSRMLEIVFSIPNYRYKIYLLRFLISLLLLAIVLILMSLLSGFALVKVPVFKMVYQLMFPLLFMAGLSFMFATLVKNASGAAVIMVIIGLFFWIMAEPLRYSKWNIFLNPFSIPSEISYTIWQNILLQNRLMLITGSVITILWALINLQKREKFV
jgi:ABC-type transport system involved in multi-copper enzyme maturation permease subunit